MSVKDFLKFVEIQSLVASALPLLLANLYSATMYDHVNGLYAMLFALVAFALQMAVNVWNNLQDFRHAVSDDWKNGENNIVGSAGISLKMGMVILLALTGFAGLIGLWLVTQVGLPLLWMGIIGFIVAFWYAGTPLPLSRTPFGELASGLTMGFLIFLAATYINVTPLMDLEMIGKAALASAICWFAIANIMLANNICDYAEDVAEDRHTLVWYLGKAKALKLFWLIYLAGYATLIAAVVFNVLPWPALLGLISLPMVYKNTKAFQADPQKARTFINSIKNAVLLSITVSLGLVIALFI